MTSTLAEAYPAGDYLAEELEARGWSQIDFAEILGRPPQFVSEIISGKKEITRESAAQIGAALGTSAELWLNLQDSYFLWRQSQNKKTQESLDEVRVRARLKDLAPVAELRKRGVITQSTTEGQANQVKKLFGMSDLFDEPKLPMAARRINHQEKISSVQMTWLACAYRQAEKLSASPYSKNGLRVLAERLSKHVKNPESFRELPQMFAQVGVALVYVEAFPSCKIDGASFMLDGKPVIALSGRGHRLDKVLFTLLHEIAHVLLGHLEEGLIVDDADESHTAGEEKPADDLAAEWILSGELSTVPRRVSHEWVTAVSDHHGVHPIVVIGRLQKAGQLTWRTALVKGAPTVTQYLQEW